MRLLIIDDDFVRVPVIRDFCKAESYVHRTAVPSHFTGFDVVTIDHDLGVEGDSYDALRKLPPETFPLETIYVIHSMNPVGTSNIKGLLDGYGLDVRVIPFGYMLHP